MMLERQCIVTQKWLIMPEYRKTTFLWAFLQRMRVNGMWSTEWRRYLSPLGIAPSC